MIQVLITGIGPVSAIGIGKTAFYTGLAARQSAVTPAVSGCPLAEVRDLKLAEILPSQKTYLDRASEFALAAVQLALNDAGMSSEDYTRWQAGVVMGSEYGCLGTMQTYTTVLQQKGARLANPLLFSHMYVNTPASLCAIEFGLGGHHGCFAGHGAGAQALEGALEALQLGRAEMIIALGVDVISEPLAQALSADGSLGEDALGEGACALVLEITTHATQRGATGFPLENLQENNIPLRQLLGNTFAAEPFLQLAARMMG